VADKLDPQSEQIASQFREARSALVQAERIFDEETTTEHRGQWPNVYRLEAATKHAQSVLLLADPQITQETAANELTAAAVQARDAIRAAVDSGGGDLTGSADRLTSATSQIEPGLISQDIPRIEELREEIEITRGQIKTQIGEAGAEVAGQKDQAFAAIKEAVEAVDTHREAANQQASELGLVTSAIAAENLADAYAIEAKRTEKQAKRYTWSSLAIGVLSVAVTVIALLTVKEASSFQTVIGHAAFGIPVALLAAYVNSLASTHRHEAWRLRHIELQIRTANPFLGLLDSGRREETLAALALRFFPGQEGVSFDGKGNAMPAPELIELLRTMLQQQGAHSAMSPSRTVPTPDPPAGVVNV
jgi:hypothetical protein